MMVFIIFAGLLLYFLIKPSYLPPESDYELVVGNEANIHV